MGTTLLDFLAIYTVNDTFLGGAGFSLQAFGRLKPAPPGFTAQLRTTSIVRMHQSLLVSRRRERKKAPNSAIVVTSSGPSNPTIRLTVTRGVTAPRVGSANPMTSTGGDSDVARKS